MWPERPDGQDKMLHFEIEVDDLDAAVAHAVASGARLAEHQPQERVRVMLDPAGHPFVCIWTEAKWNGRLRFSMPCAGRRIRRGTMLDTWSELIRCQDTHGKTGLHLTAGGDEVEVARVLLACRRYRPSLGRDQRARGHGGACCLLDGANATIGDDRFDASPAGWAREGGHTAIADVIGSCGGSD